MKVDYLIAEIGSTTTVVTGFNVKSQGKEISIDKLFQEKAVLQFWTEM